MGSRWFLSTAAAVSTLVIGAGRVPVWSLDLPSAWMAVDSTRARLGDPLQLRLSLSFATGGEPRFPELTELPGGCVARSLPETAVRRHENGIEHAEMRYELRCYELGTHEIPPPEVAIFGPGADTLIRPPQAIEIAIVGTREAGDEVLRDIKPPMHIPGGIPLWLLAVALASLLVAAAAVLSWVVNRRSPAAHPLPSSSPTDFAAEFARIAAMGLLERGAFKIYYTLLSEALRHFLEEKAGVEALERTTGEIAASVDQLAIDSVLVKDIIEFLSEADLVKFARATPGIEQARKTPEAGKEIVRAVEAALAPPPPLAEDAQVVSSEQAAV